MSWKWPDFFVDTIQGILVLILSAKDDAVYFWTEPRLEEAVRKTLWGYFRLDTDLSTLYVEWSQRDNHFAKLCSKYPGVRLLAQPAFESLLSFICSQNNGISRITSMVRTLKEHYGIRHTLVDDEITLFTFPRPSDLLDEKITRELTTKGFGYRARYIQAVSKKIVAGEIELETLKDAPRDEARNRLLQIVGVGPKVADCVALTGLGQMSSVPIDTHIWKMAKSCYTGMPSGKSLTHRVYNSIGDRFRAIFGPYAGWAHLVLFAVQIKQKSVKSK